MPSDSGGINVGVDKRNRQFAPGLPPGWGTNSTTIGAEIVCQADLGRASFSCCASYFLSRCASYFRSRCASYFRCAPYFLAQCAATALACRLCILLECTVSTRTHAQSAHERGSPTSASLGSTDCSRVDMPGVRYRIVNCGAENSPGSPNW